MKKGKYNRNLKALCVTLIILTVLGVFSQAENSIVSSGINAATKGLFRLSAMATSSADSATRDELLKENEELKKENATVFLWARMHQKFIYSNSNLQNR